MTTITYRVGDARPLIFALRDDTGALAAGELQLRVSAQGGCIAVPCTPSAEGFAADLAALSALPARSYGAALWLRRTGGWEHLGGITLIIAGGC